MVIPYNNCDVERSEESVGTCRLAATAHVFTPSRERVAEGRKHVVATSVSEWTSFGRAYSTRHTRSYDVFPTLHSLALAATKRWHGRSPVQEYVIELSAQASRYAVAEVAQDFLRGFGHQKREVSRCRRVRGAAGRQHRGVVE